MPRSLKAHPGCLDTLRIAIKRNGFLTQRALSERAGYSLATVKKFLGGKPVDFATFTELCETLNLEWEDVADLGIDLPKKASSQVKKSEEEPSSSDSNSDPDNSDNPSTVQSGKTQSGKTQSPTKRSTQDWGKAIDSSIFFGREQSLAMLESWLVQDRCRLVAICGIGGIGKTTLSAKLAHRVADQFDYLVWRSLKNAPPIQETLASILNFFLEQPEVHLAGNEAAGSLDAQQRQLMDCLRSHRCFNPVGQVSECRTWHCLDR